MKYSTRRRPAYRRRRRYSKKRYVGRRRAKYTGNQVVKIKRTLNQTIQGDATVGAPWTPGGGGTSGTAAINGLNLYQLSDLPNATEFTSLFEYYRIKGVKIRMHLRHTTNWLTAAAGATSLTQPQIYYAKTNSSYTSDILWGPGSSTITDANQNTNLQIRVLNVEKPINIFIRPKMSARAYDSTISDAYVPMSSNQWCPTGNPNTNFYGLAFAIDEFVNPNQYIDCAITYYVEFKGTK